jgi:hypothetical protein
MGENELDVVIAIDQQAERGQVSGGVSCAQAE